MANKDFLSDLNEEKQKIIKTDGNVLVVANPGTGKTKLLAYKFVYLLKNGLKSEEILCLTFTNKTKKELENIDYDKEADVLYISFEKPQNADDSIMQGNMIIHNGKITLSD